MKSKLRHHNHGAVLETLEVRALLSASPAIIGERTFPTHTTLKVEAGALGQPITFDVTVRSRDETPRGPLDLYYHGKLFQELPPTNASFDGQFWAVEGTYTVPAGTAGAEMFGAGLHAVRAQFIGTYLLFYPSAAVAVFRVTPPKFVVQQGGVKIATLSAGSGPALQPGQSATVQLNSYLASTYRLVYSTESQTPDTESFVVDANPEEALPGLDAGVVGMQAGETRAIYVPYPLAYGAGGVPPTVPPRANLVFLVTLASIS